MVKYGTPEYEALYASRSTPEKRAAAEEWYRDLMSWIADQEKRWESKVDTGPKIEVKQWPTKRQR
jgi:hypothetical protein